MNGTKQSIETVTGKLCVSCALCCNGVIFRDVKLRRGDDGEKLKRLGLPIANRGNGILPQPCAALEGCRCRVYADRPIYCRQFECALFKKVLDGHVKTEAALRLIRTARNQANTVSKLLRGLGDIDEQLPLSARFHGTARRLNRTPPNKSGAALYGSLTLAMHELNLMLSQNFYPGTLE